MTIKTAGQAAYTTYVEMPSATMPWPWDELKADEKKGWENVARAVCKFIQRCPECGNWFDNSVTSDGDWSCASCKHQWKVEAQNTPGLDRAIRAIAVLRGSSAFPYAGTLVEALMEVRSHIMGSESKLEAEHPEPHKDCPDPTRCPCVCLPCERAWWAAGRPLVRARLDSASKASAYHPDPEINEGVAKDVAEAEAADLRAGFPPRRWTCPQCGASHSRGHHQSIGQHRCLRCGYVGTGGVMWDKTEEPPFVSVRSPEGPVEPRVGMQFAYLDGKNWKTYQTTVVSETGSVWAGDSFTIQSEPWVDLQREGRLVILPSAPDLGTKPAEVFDPNRRYYEEREHYRERMYEAEAERRAAEQQLALIRSQRDQLHAAVEAAKKFVTTCGDHDSKEAEALMFSLNAAVLLADK